MKKHILMLYCMLFMSPAVLRPQNAPITSAGIITNATPGNQAVTIPVTVTGFSNIGQFTLTMTFDTTKVQYVSEIPNPSLTGMTVTYSSPAGNNIAKLVITWSNTVNISLANGSSLVNLTFRYITGTGNLNWVDSSPSICEYKSYINTILTILNDSPQYLFYLNGGISNRVAPITFAPSLPNPVPGSIPVPITVNGFNDIGALTINFMYDPAVIVYLNSYTNNSVFTANFVVGDNPGLGGKRMITISWFGSSVNLANGSSLCTLNFDYPSSNCNPCALNWYENGPSCEYTDGSANVLIDMPQSTYYFDGLVPAGLLPTWTGAVSNAWNNVSNWNSCGIPDITCDVVIPNVSPNPFPIVTTAATCKSVKIQTGATLSVSPTGVLTVGN